MKWRFLVVGLLAAIAGCGGSDQSSDTRPEVGSRVVGPERGSFDVSSLLSLSDEEALSAADVVFSGLPDDRARRELTLRIADVLAASGTHGIEQHPKLTAGILHAVRVQELVLEAVPFIEVIAESEKPDLSVVISREILVNMEQDPLERLAQIDLALQACRDLADADPSRRPTGHEHNLLFMRYATMHQLGQRDGAIEAFRDYIQYAADRSSTGLWSEQWINGQRAALALMLDNAGRRSEARAIMEQIVDSEAHQQDLPAHRISDAHMLAALRHIPPGDPRSIAIYEPLWNDAEAYGTYSWFLLAPGLARAYEMSDGTDRRSLAVWADVLSASADSLRSLDDRENERVQEIIRMAREALDGQ